MKGCGFVGVEYHFVPKASFVLIGLLFFWCVNNCFINEDLLSYSPLPSHIHRDTRAECLCVVITDTVTQSGRCRLPFFLAAPGFLCVRTGADKGFTVADTELFSRCCVFGYLQLKSEVVRSGLKVE